MKKDIPSYSSLKKIEVYNKSWRPNTQHSKYSQQYCIIKFKVAKRLHLNYSHHKKMLIM